MSLYPASANGNGHANGAVKLVPLNQRRLPPQNIEIEQALLGAVIRDPSQLHVVITILKPDDFFRASHTTIYQAVKDLYDAGRPIDLPLVIEELERRGEFENVGGDEYFDAIMNGDGQLTWHAAEYAGVIREKASLRQLATIARKLEEDAYAGAEHSLEIAGAVQQATFEVVSRCAGSAGKMAGEVADEALLSIDRRLNNEITGVKTGLRAIDDVTDGLQDGEMIVIAARPSQGKSALGMNICERVAFKANAFTLFVSLEMKSRALGLRLLASQSGVSASKFRVPKTLTNEDYAAIGEAHRRIASGRLMIDDTPARTVSQIGAIARSLKASKNLRLLVIDYLGRIDGEYRKGESRQNEVARISSGLSDIAQSLNIPTVVLHQLNRASENREDRRPRISDLRDSGAVEQDADVVILLHRPSFYDPSDRPGEVDAFIAKNRNGDVKAVRLAFQKELTRFTDLEVNARNERDYQDDWSE